MKTVEILNRIYQLPKPNAGECSLTQISELYYCGKDINDNIVLVLKASSDKGKRLSQATHDLRLDINAKDIFSIEGKREVLSVHILTCFTQDMIKRLAFIRLFNAFIEEENDIEDITIFFNALISLFSGRSKCPTNEIQGLFAELYTMVFFEEKGIDLYQFWQSEDRRTHDFCVTNKKRIEVKSTSKDIRIHRFRHEQLLSDLHDVKVVSMFTKRVDKGLSLLDLVQKIRESSLVKYRVMMHIEQSVAGFSEDQLKDIQFDENLLNSTIAIYEASDIPHFDEKQPNGVFNAEYDSDLTTSKVYPMKEFFDWIRYQLPT